MMKNFKTMVIVGAFLGIFGLGTYSLIIGDGLFTTPSTADLLQPDTHYELDTWGSNSEVYEFTPKGNDGMTCIMFMLDSKNAMGLQCYPKK